jgi:hypothetical protein
MLTTEETLAAMRREMRLLLETAMEGVLTRARGVLEEAEQQCAKGLMEVAEERAKALAEERAKALAVVDTRRGELAREVATMQTHLAKQEGRVELNIGGYRFETSVQTLRRVPHTFFDASFSGRYAQDVCDDGSIFVDRDGEHFGHVLEYMRDGVVSMAEPGAHPSVSLLRLLKREFGFYCIELCVEQAVVEEQPEVAYVMGGTEAGDKLASMERYDASSGQWIAVAAMITARSLFGACVVAGELYATGGVGRDQHRLSSVEKYTPSSDTWSAIAPLPFTRSRHSAVAMKSNMYVMGGKISQEGAIATVLRFDSVQGTWSDVAPMPAATSAFAACAMGSDIYVFGGGENAHLQKSVFKYDTEANAWSTLSPMPHMCTHHSACVLDSLIYLIGARDGNGVLRFDPALGSWSTLAPTSYSRIFGASFVVGGCLYAAGGRGSPSSMERYDVASNTWTVVADMLESRKFFVAVSIESVRPAEERDLFDSLIAKASI